MAVTLAWELAADSPPADGFRLYQQVDDGAEQAVGTLDGDARSTGVQLGVGPPRRSASSRSGSTDGSATASAWSPITASRHQESSGGGPTRGAWRGSVGSEPVRRGRQVQSERRGDHVVHVRRDRRRLGGHTDPGQRPGRRSVSTASSSTRSTWPPSDVHYRQLLARAHATDDGPHVLTIRVVGDGRVDVDAFVVLR